MQKRIKHICARSALSLAAMLLFGILVPSASRAQQSQPSAKPAQTPPAKRTAKSPAASSAGKTHSSSTAPKASAPARPGLATEKQKDSYALGINMGRNLAQQPIDIEVASFLQGLRDALEKQKPQLTDSEIEAALAQLQSQANAKIQADNQAVGEANLKEGEAFLAGNKTKPGVVALPSGLQYKIITAGTGPKPAASDVVVCDYRGTLINGKEFDSSYKRGQPASFPVNGVIKGWTEALQMMPVGSKWELFIPPDLAYGSRGAGSDIGPNSTLIFEVELHSIKGK
jgi:FKBP-type peptidyl-prolyl cis-trans isomerase FklB